MSAQKAQAQPIQLFSPKGSYCNWIVKLKTLNSCVSLDNFFNYQSLVFRKALDFIQLKHVSQISSCTYVLLASIILCNVTQTYQLGRHRRLQGNYKWIGDKYAEQTGYICMLAIGTTDSLTICSVDLTNIQLRRNSRLNRQLHNVQKTRQAKEA